MDSKTQNGRMVFCGLFVAWTLFNCIVCPPVDPNSPEAGLDPGPPHDVNNDTDPAFNLEYGRYLSEVVKILETDKEFAKKLENVSQDDIRSGHIATHLDLVDHKVRSKLDELKRIEVDRLRKLTQKKNELEHGVYRDGRLWRSVPKKGIDRDNVINDHLDQDNHHTFEIEDLKKLILAATRDLDKLDEARKAQFKEYEMEKEYEFQQGLKNKTEEEKKIEQKKHEEEKHKKHPKAHQPGSKVQLEQVWEEEDHMDRQDFDPKTFFAMHDLNGDGVLDDQEVEAILQLEAKRMYMSDPNHPGDPRTKTEMDEEVNRMREHLFKRVDKDKDGLISRQEFLDMTAAQDFDQDDGWKGLDEQQIYTDEELQHFMQMRAMQQQQAYMQQGMQYNPGYPGSHGGPGYPQQGGPQMGYHPQQQMNFVPQGGHPQGGQHPQMMQQQQMYPTQGGQYGHPPQGGQYGHPPQGAYQAGHPQMGGNQVHNNPGQYQQIPLQGHGPPQGQVHPQGQVNPQGQVHSQGQVPLQGQVNPQGQVAQQGIPAPKVTAGQGAPQANYQAPSQQNFNQQQQQQQGGARQFNNQPNQPPGQQQFGQAQQQFNQQAQQYQQQMPAQQKLQPPPAPQQQPQAAQFKAANPPIVNQASVRS